MQKPKRTLAATTLDKLPYLISRYDIDPAHASAQFKVRHLMVSSVRGELGEVTGFVLLNQGDITQSSVNATIDVTAINTRNAERDAHLITCRGRSYPLVLKKRPSSTTQARSTSTA